MSISCFFHLSPPFSHMDPRWFWQKLMPWLEMFEDLSEGALKRLKIIGIYGQATPRNTPWMINMEHNHRGLEDHVPF